MKRKGISESNKLKTRRPVGRPSDLKKRDAILDAAWTLFLKQGVEGTTNDEIAKKAEVSKVTLYKNFNSKDEIFEACVVRETDRINDSQLPSLVEGRDPDLKQILRAFGIGLMTFLFSDVGVAFYNVVSGELHRHKDLSKRFYENGPGNTHKRLSDILCAASVENQLCIENPEEAAEHLVGLWQGFSNFQLSLGQMKSQIRSTVETRVDKGIEIFLRAYSKPK